MSKDFKQYGHKPPEDRTEAEGRQLRLRSGLLIVLFLGVLLAYGYVLYNTQIVNGDDYLTTASYTTRQTETVDSVRGEILDSFGRVLVSNTFGYEVTLDTSVMDSDRNEILAELLLLCRETGVEWSDSLPITASPPYYFTKPDVYTYLLTKTATDDDGNEIETTEERRTNLGALAVKYKWIDDPLAEKPEEKTKDDTGSASQSLLDKIRGFFGLGSSAGEEPEEDPKKQEQEAETYLTAQELMVKMCKSFGVELPETPEGELPEISQEVRDLLGVLYELALRSKGVVYTEYVFAKDVDITFISKAKERDLTGVLIDSVPSRQYNTTYAAHVLGLTGDIPSEQWEAYKELGYSYDAVVGRSGVEFAFEDYLKGTSGIREIATSDSGKIISQKWTVDEETGKTLEPVPGGNVTLTLDIGLQAVVENALAEHVESLEESGGAACAVVNMTGGVLSLASYPTYDLATYSQNYNELSEDPLHPYLNRATQGLYSPGSTFKLLTATAGLMEGIITPKDTIRCTGIYSYEGWKDHHPQCWYYRAYHAGHGTENLAKAIKDSCNIYFYDVGRRVGIAKLNEYAEQFGLGQHTGVEIGDATGSVAGPETSLANNQVWYEGNITFAAIGQENNQFTPLQIANYIATLVNGGDHYAAHLLKSVKSSDYSEVLYEYEPQLLNTIDISDEALAAMKEGMYQVTQNAAIAKYFNGLPVKAGAKTGTAQISATSEETNGLLVVFAPYDDPQIALCIVMEKGASGSSLASIAADILNYYFSSDIGLSAVAEENTLLH